MLSSKELEIVVWVELIIFKSQLILVLKHFALFNEIASNGTLDIVSVGNLKHAKTAKSCINLITAEVCDAQYWVPP